MNKVLLILFFLSGILRAQYDFDSLLRASDDFKKSVEIMSDTLDLFSENHPLEVTIISDFKNLIKKKYDGDYQDAQFILKFNDTVQVKRNIEIKPRGNFRLKACYFPPIKLNFKKKEAFFTTLSDFDKLKMVNNCKMNDAFEKYILSEFLVYKMYNIVSPYSFRVRLISLKYIDTGRSNKESNSYAFIIEPEEQLMERLNGFILDKKGFSPKMIDEIYENRMAIFQYMIGNTDYSIPALHNIKLFKVNDYTVEDPYPIPYDFDYSGLVSTPYAIPSESLSIKTVQERLYMGNCQDVEIFGKNIRFFFEKKDQMYEVLKNDFLLDEKYKKQILNYLDGFYEEISNENVVKRNLIMKCRND